LKFQSVELRRDSESAFSIAHLHKTITVTGHAPPRVESKRFSATMVATPARREYILEIGIASFALASVRWDGKELIDDLWPDDHPLPRQKITLGGFGLLNFVSATTFTRARVLLLED
jgi:hypothetical protein